MFTQRYNIYTNIHKALRFSMCETLCALGRLDGCDELAFQQQMDATAALLNQCLHHLQHENTFVHPIIQSVCTGDIFTSAEEHVVHQHEIAQLLNNISQVRVVDTVQRAAFILDFYRDFSVFVAENFIHMRDEETTNCQLLWTHFSDSQIQSIEQTLVASIPPDENLQTLLTMLPNISHTERLNVLAGVKAGAPAPVFAYLMAELRARLSVDSWSKLTAAMTLSSGTNNNISDAA